REINSTTNNGNGHLSNHVNDPLKNAKIKVPTLLRKLPEIPVNSNLNPNDGGGDSESTVVDLQTVDSGSELYATVESSKRQRINQELDDSNNELADVSIDTTRSRPLTTTIETVPDLLKSTNVNPTISSGDSESDNLYSQVHHRYDKVKKENPYARVKGQTSEERDTDTENYDDSTIYTKTAGKSDYDQRGISYEPVPPVPEKKFDQQFLDEDVLAQPSTSASHLTAANAVTGRVSATEIPYVTSPIDSPLRQPVVQQRPISQPQIVPDLVYNTSQDSGDGQDIRYTSISVREPLANLRSNLERNLQQERQESYYMVVSDDDLEQTYDEIREQSSGNGTTPYATIDLRDGTRDLPPVPPPVESLRSIASVKSKKSTSASSSGIPSSDNDSRHPSPYASSAAVSSSPLSDSSELYSTVNKPKVYNRRTIHVVDQQSLEEMYAKVLKHKHMSLVNDNISTSLLTVSQSKSKVPLPELPSTSSKESINQRPKSVLANNDLVPDQLNNAQSVNDLGAKLDPGYESVQELVEQSTQSGSSGSPFDDPVYERIIDGVLNVNSDDDFLLESFDVQPGYETVVEARNLDRNSNPPVQDALQLDPGYETVNHNVLCNNPEIDPDYEEIGRRQMSDFGSGSEPGYEQIRSKTLETEQEPGYEMIKINGTNERSSNAQLDDVYETINYDNKDKDFCYDRLGSPYDDGEDEFSDPSYEQVNFKLDNSDNSTYKARESWDLSPMMEILSDGASGSMTSLQEDISRSSNDVEHYVAQIYHNNDGEHITEP
uniref:Uncharacterized protein n=1 Tax=Strigamia maritima TaxID=126957 RepID=T1JMT2_STRMM